MPNYQSRRTFVRELFDPLANQVRTGQVSQYETTGWERLDRCVGEIRGRLSSARTEEQFQAVGLLCREAMISLAQAVHLPDQHPTLDGVPPSETDARRKLEAYVAVEAAGSSNETLRKHIRSALDLAVQLQHQRTAIFRNAAMCVEATTAVINMIAIISGRRDP